MVAGNVIGTPADWENSVMATATDLKCTFRCSTARAGDGEAMIGGATAVVSPLAMVWLGVVSAGLHLGGEELHHLGGGVSINLWP